MEKPPDRITDPQPAVLSYADSGTDAEESIERYLARRDLEARTSAVTLFMVIPSITGAILGIIVLAHGPGIRTVALAAIFAAPGAMAITHVIAVGKLARSRAACMITLVIASLIIVYAVGVAAVGVAAMWFGGTPCVAIPVLGYDAVGIYLCVRVIIDAGRYLTLTHSGRPM